MKRGAAHEPHMLRVRLNGPFLSLVFDPLLYVERIQILYKLYGTWTYEGQRLGLKGLLAAV